MERYSGHLNQDRTWTVSVRGQDNNTNKRITDEDDLEGHGYSVEIMISSPSIKKIIGNLTQKHNLRPEDPERVPNRTMKIPMGLDCQHTAHPLAMAMISKHAPR